MASRLRARTCRRCNLWATWCEPCRAEIPFFVKLQSELSPAGFRVVGISLDTAGNRREAVSRFRSNFHINYPMGFPPPLSQMQSGLNGLPTTLLFDRNGRAAKVYVGEVSQRSFRADVAELLREQQGSLSGNESSTSAAVLPRTAGSSYP